MGSFHRFWLVPLGCGEDHREFGTAFGAVGDFEHPPVIFHDALAYGQAQSGPPALGGVEGDEEIGHGEAAKPAYQDA